MRQWYPIQCCYRPQVVMCWADEPVRSIWNLDRTGIPQWASEDVVLRWWFVYRNATGYLERCQTRPSTMHSLLTPRPTYTPGWAQKPGLGLGLAWLGLGLGWPGLAWAWPQAYTVLDNQRPLILWPWVFLFGAWQEQPGGSEMLENIHLEGIEDIGMSQSS